MTIAAWTAGRGARPTTRSAPRSELPNHGFMGVRRRDKNTQHDIDLREKHFNVKKGKTTGPSQQVKPSLCVECLHNDFRRLWLRRGVNDDALQILITTTLMYSVWGSVRPRTAGVQDLASLRSCPNLPVMGICFAWQHGLYMQNLDIKLNNDARDAGIEGVFLWAKQRI